MFGARVFLRGQRFQTQGQTEPLRVVILVGLLCVLGPLVHRVVSRFVPRRCKVKQQERSFGCQCSWGSLCTVCRRRWQCQSNTFLRCPLCVLVVVCSVLCVTIFCRVLSVVFFFFCILFLFVQWVLFFDLCWLFVILCSVLVGLCALFFVLCLCSLFYGLCSPLCGLCSLFFFVGSGLLG